jgi:hypothetical protein
LFTLRENKLFFIRWPRSFNMETVLHAFCRPGILTFGLGAVLMMTLGTALAFGDANSGATKRDSSLSKSGTKLKWLPSRPEQNDSTVTAVQYTEPADEPSPMAKRIAGNQRNSGSPRIAQKPQAGAFNDPFGDAKATTQPPATIETAPEAELQQVPSEPKVESTITPGLMPLAPATKSAVEQPLRPATEPSSSSPYLPGLAPEEETVPSPVAPPKKISKPTVAVPLSNGSVHSKKTEAVQPSLDRPLATQEHQLNDNCPSPKDMKKIRELTTNIKPSEGDIPRRCPLDSEVYRGRSWSPTTYTWTASALCHKPLYFDDTQLERYGHMWGPWVQPFASGARFFGTVLILPYEMGLEPPCECIYALGDYQPGDCAPYLLDPIPISVRAALFEAGACAGGVFLLH